MKEIDENGCKVGGNMSPEQLIEALSAERESSREKSVLIAMLLHEMGALLTIIQVSSDAIELCGNKLNDGERAEYFQSIKAAILQMKNIADSVLVFGKIQGTQSPSKHLKLDIARLCKDVVRDVCFIHGKKGIIISISKFVPMHIHIDSLLMRCILSNLLSNAVKYSDGETAITLRLCCEAGNLVMYVQDRGIGIPAADMANIFLAFRRGANTGGRKGIGLGMFMVKHCVAVLGGCVCVNSKENVGTTFKVTVPYPLPQASSLCH
jgi:signal transduction histidine kinase